MSNIAEEINNIELNNIINKFINTFFRAICNYKILKQKNVLLLKSISVA